MPFITPGKPTKIKNKIYLGASTILGVLLSFLVYAFCEFRYLDWVTKNDQSPDFSYDYLFLILFLFLGVVGGFFLGKFWWRKLYVERVWAKRIKRK